MLPQLRGLIPPQSPEESNLYAPICQLLRSFYLRKWCIHGIFCYMDDSNDGILQQHEFEQICRLSAAMDELAQSPMLRLEAYRVSVERQMQTLAANDEDVDVDEVEADHQCLHFAGLLGHDLLHERHLLEVHLKFTQHAEKQGAHDTIDIEILEHALVDDLFTWELEPEIIQRAVKEVMASSISHGDRTVRFNKFVNLQDLLTNCLVCEVCSVLSEPMQAMFRLLREHNRVLEAIKMTANSGVFGAAEITFLFQLVAWAHVAVLSQYHSGYDFISVGTLDQIHVVFALLPWIEVGIHLRNNGLRKYLLQSTGGAEAMYSWGTLVCLLCALPGVIVVETESYEIMSLGTARFLIACASLTIFTQNDRFSQMLQTLGTVSAASWPVVLSLIAVTCMYARAAQDIFSDMVKDDYGKGYLFSTYGKIVYPAQQNTCDRKY